MRFFLTDRGLGVVSNPATLGVFMALHAPRVGPNRGESRRHDEGNPSSGVGLFAPALVLAAAVGAQSLSTPTFSNNSNPDELVAGTPTTPSRERETAVTFDSSSSAGRRRSARRARRRTTRRSSRANPTDDRARRARWIVPAAPGLSSCERHRGRLPGSLQSRLLPPVDPHDEIDRTVARRRAVRYSRAARSSQGLREP
jgi:hypothetical protein